jgi:hypothetical protein
MDTIAEEHYSSRLLFILTLLVGLNILDSLFTMMILDLGGEEVNFLVRSAIQAYGDRFWIWKFALVSVSAVLLCLGSRLKYVKGVIVGLACLYFVVVAYQIALLNLH